MSSPERLSISWHIQRFPIAVAIICIYCFAVYFIKMRPASELKALHRIKQHCLDKLHYSWADERLTNREVQFFNGTESSFVKSEVDVARHRLTLVTGYVNIGTFQKGSKTRYHNPGHYMGWLKAFSLVENPVLAFFDDVNTAAYFRSIRRHLPDNLTRTVVFERSDLWIFNQLPRISAIFHQKGYPKHLPNTVVPLYAAATIAKYMFVKWAVEKNVFYTGYFAWVDAGYFRYLATGQQHSFKLDLPPNFDSNKVAHMEIRKRNPKLTVRAIVYKNVNWVAGGYFVATGSVMHKWTKEVLNMAETMMQANLMGAEQQVIYALFNRGKPTVRLQTYHKKGKSDAWFQLGYRSKQTSDNTVEVNLTALI